MTKIVYASPDISPDVWTPPRGVVVLPLSEHPAIIAESRIEKLPGEPKRTPRRKQSTQVLLLFKYLRQHPPADVYAIADALDLNWENVRKVLVGNPRLFRKTGRAKAGTHGHSRVLWGLVEDSRNA